MDQKVKIGLIGAGAIVESSHLPVLKNMQNAEVVWVYDQNIKRSRLLSDMYNISVIESNWQQALENTDICLLTIPYGVRKPYIEEVAKQNKALYVEKPFALTVREHQQYLQMFPAGKLAVGFQRRYYQSIHNLSKIIEDNVLGKLKKISVKQGYFTLKGGAGYLSNAQLSGGGVILESAIHLFDQLLQVTAASDVTVSSFATLQRKGIDYDSFFSGAINTTNGIIPYEAEITTLRNLENGYVFECEQAVVYCKTSPNASIYIQTPGAKKNIFELKSVENISSSYVATSVGQSFFLFWKDFIDAVNQSAINHTSASTSLLTTKWMENIYQYVRN